MKTSAPQELELILVDKDMQHQLHARLTYLSKFNASCWPHFCQSNVLQECYHPSHASEAAMKTVVITLVASSSKTRGQLRYKLQIVGKER